MKPVFIMTQNVRNFVSLMSEVEARVGHDSLAEVVGRAGRGKTRTMKWYAAQNDCVYLTTLRDWSPLWLYQDVLSALNVDPENIPGRKKTAFEMIVTLARERRRPFILDEADLLGARLLETVRDLCKVTAVPWVLVGEESLSGLMNRDRRVWSRRIASLEFGPMSIPDIIAYSEKGAELTLTAENADVIQRATGGDIRLIDITVTRGETIARTNGAKELTKEIIEKALATVIKK